MGRGTAEDEEGRVVIEVAGRDEPTRDRSGDSEASPACCVDVEGIAGPLPFPFGCLYEESDGWHVSARNDV